MMKYKDDTKLFIDLWSNGVRFTTWSEEDEDNVQRSPVVLLEKSPYGASVTTVADLRRMVRDGLIVHQGQKLPEEFVDMFVNAVAFAKMKEVDSKPNSEKTIESRGYV